MIRPPLICVNNNLIGQHFVVVRQVLKFILFTTQTTKVPTFFSITTASKHDKKAAEKMPLLDGATYVFDRAYNDYAWYYSMSLRDYFFCRAHEINDKV
ncbi:MAG: hypothetical protein Q9N62_09665 [Ghiorsea sp.]|nr:hypothetical protein [Ghiorsea sp.]